MTCEFKPAARPFGHTISRIYHFVEGFVKTAKGVLARGLAVSPRASNLATCLRASILQGASRRRSERTMTTASLWQRGVSGRPDVHLYRRLPCSLTKWIDLPAPLDTVTHNRVLHVTDLSAMCSPHSPEWLDTVKNAESMDAAWRKG